MDGDLLSLVRSFPVVLACMVGFSNLSHIALRQQDRTVIEVSLLLVLDSRFWFLEPVLVLSIMLGGCGRDRIVDMHRLCF